MTEGRVALGALALLAIWLFIGLPLFYHPLEGREFLGLGPEAWTAVGTLLLVGVTTFVGGVGLYQINEARAEAARNRTITACDRYDTDPILDRCCLALVKARKDGLLEGKPQDYRIEIFTILNYLEGIAIGVEQGLYVEEIAKSYMEPILKAYVELYVLTGLSERADPRKGKDQFGSYGKLVEMCNKWGSNYKMPSGDRA